jgi:multidrug/hemolysin transport system permease protein
MIYNLMLRNLRIYFRDKASVFFSLLGVFVIIGLYVLFLGDGIISAFSYLFINSKFVMDTWIMSGVIATASITTTMGAFGIMVEDNSKKVIKDFMVSPLKRWQLVLGYVLSSVIIGLVMSLFTLLLAEIYIVMRGGEFLSILGLLKTLGLILLSVSASSAMVFLLVVFIKSPNAFATASTLLGTLIGFFMGIYIPIGSYSSEGIQLVIKCFPISHAGALMRQVMMEEAIVKELTTIPIPEGAPTLADFRTFMGVDFQIGSYLIPTWLHLLILVLTVIIFFSLTTLVMSRRKIKE